MALLMHNVASHWTCTKCTRVGCRIPIAMRLSGRPCAAQTRYFPIFENYKNESINMFLAGYPADKARWAHMPIPHAE